MGSPFPGPVWQRASHLLEEDGSRRNSPTARFSIHPAELMSFEYKDSRKWEPIWRTRMDRRSPWIYQDGTGIRLLVALKCAYEVQKANGAHMIPRVREKMAAIRFRKKNGPVLLLDGTPD